MNRIMLSRIIVSAVLASSLLVSCAKQGDEASGNKVSNSQSDGIIVQAPTGGAAVTATIVSFDNVLTNMLSVTGVSPSSTTTTLYNTNKTAYAVNGKVNEINAGMWMAVASLAGSVCKDLYDKEALLPAASRTFYREVDLAAATNFTTVTNGKSAENAIIERLSLTFWGKPAAALDIADFKTALDAVAATRNTMSVANTREALLIICTGALSSLKAIEI